jgi:broad specificity phosphatase PhoE
MICKKVILVRHAESSNNASKRTWSRTFGSLHLPSTWAELGQVASLATFPMDSALTADGLGMIDRQRAAFQDLMRSSGTTVVIHSHLQRARQTAAGLCAGEATLKLEECPILFEKSLGEYVRIASFQTRVSQFKQLLASRQEERVALVGHSAFFRKLVPQMQARKREVGNVSVWRMDLMEDGSWQNVELLVPGWMKGLGV